MMRSLGVARVMSVKEMQILSPGLMISFSGFDPIGFSSAWRMAVRSSFRPAV